ncbi:4-hydroxybenzoate octaprenyltransferase [Martiniozyma asiatica (nom. inval.)]|nr:4-hydroxybenzoate octaprenyltransferase [Martiniozyma asiatica]
MFPLIASRVALQRSFRTSTLFNAGLKKGLKFSQLNSSINVRCISSNNSKQTVSSILNPPAAPVFSKEELEEARIARLKGLGILKKFPENWIPYMELMRIEKPIGTYLLLSPCTWSITMAAFMTSAPLLSTLWMLGVFSVGAFVMRGAGCTINDIWDRGLDNQVARTMERPITSGRVSVKQATVFLGAQLVVGLGVLLQLPLDCFLLGASSLLLVGTYPLFKRFTYYPQVALSACFNWGALLGFPAMGVWDWNVMIPLYLSGFFWCMHYDTIYAHQDKKFDIKAGIKSTALAWGDKSKKIFTGLSVAQMACYTTSGVLAGMGPGFMIGALVGGWRLFDMTRRVDLNNPADCWFWFKNNIHTGNVFFLGILFDYLLRLAGFL